MKSVYDDWTGNVVQEADIRSFDPEAVRAVRATYVSEHPDDADAVSGMDDQTFLSHIGVLKRGKVTVASMILMGKASEKVLPSTLCIRWRLLDVDGTVSDIPFIPPGDIVFIPEQVKVIGHIPVYPQQFSYRRLDRYRAQRNER